MADDFGSFIKKHTEAQKQSEEYLKSIAESQIGGEKYNTKDRLNAKRQLAAMEKTLEQQVAASGYQKDSIQTLDIMNMGIKEQEARMAKQAEILEELGVEAKENAEYRKEQLKLERMKLAQAKATGSKQAEKEAKDRLRELKSNTFLGKIANGIGTLTDKAKEKVKAGAKGILGMLKGLAFGAFTLAVLAFLNSPYFDKTMKFIKDKIVPALASFWKAIKKGGQALITLFTGKDKDGNPVSVMERLAGVFSPSGALVLGIGGIVALFAAAKVAKKLAPLKSAIGGLFRGLGGLAKKLPGIPKFGGAGAGAGGPSGAVAKTAGGIGAKIKAAGKGLGGFISGLLKGIASGLGAFANPAALVGLAAMAAAFLAVSAAIRIMSPAFEPIGKLAESVGEAIKSAFEGIGEIVRSVGDSVGTVIEKMGKSIQGVIDSITDMKTAGTKATTEQIQKLSKIPADALFAAARGIDAMKAALDGFGGSTFGKIVGKFLGSGGPIEKIIELSEKVPELMKAAEAITILGAAGSNYAMAEAEIERREKVADLKKRMAGSYRLRTGTKAEDQAKLAALEGQAMAMPAGGVGGNLTKITGLVAEIVRMQKENAAQLGNIISAPVNAPTSNSTTTVTTVQKQLAPTDRVTSEIRSSK